VLKLRVADIDGERKLLRITQGKGAKDRLVALSPTLLEQLRTYWRLYHPQDWLFAGYGGTPLSPTSLQKAFTRSRGSVLALLHRRVRNGLRTMWTSRLGRGPTG